ncbi:MAG: hypothetical protein OEY52_16975 [Gammaproteobacteria bacterium]|nr:hypothetical protein [Gammaproteobacteria bacterium]
MKITSIFSGILLVAISGSVMAKDVPLINEVDFLEASAQASKHNKRLLTIYRQDDCEECDRFISDLAQNQNNTKYNKYSFYQVSTNKGIEVVCPNGLELSDNEYFEAKGIHGKLSLVFHDEYGNVVYTHNGIPAHDELYALMDFVHEEKYADGSEYVPNS